MAACDQAKSVIQSSRRCTGFSSAAGVKKPHFCGLPSWKLPMCSPTCLDQAPSKASLGAVEPSLDFATVPESVAGKSRDGTFWEFQACLQDYLDCLLRA